MKETQKRDFTQGPILSSLAKISIPIIFANLLQTAYQMTDTFWVGRLGNDAVAAVSVSFPVLFFMISVGIGITMAGSILIAQYKGSKDLQNLSHITTQTYVLVTVISIGLSFLGYFLTDPILRAMQVEEKLFSDASIYLKINFVGIIFTYTYMIFQSLMRGIGEVRIPMMVVLLTVILNLVLDPLFIFGYKSIPGYGVMGAAIATLLTQIISSIIGTIILLKGNYGIQLQLSNYKPDYHLFKRIFKLGVPTSIEQSMRSLGMLAMTTLVTYFGSVTLAAYGIGMRLFSFVLVPTVGLSIATTTLVGQNMGAGKIERVEKTAKLAMIAGFFSTSIIGVLFYFFATDLARFFIPNEPETIALSAQFLKILSFTFGLLAVAQVMAGVFRGAGDTMITMVISIISIWILRFPLAYYLSRHTDLRQNGIWYSFLIEMSIATALYFLWYFRGSWKKIKLTEEKILSEKTHEASIVEEGLES